MMKFIGHLLALLLSTALSIAIMLWTLGNTLGSATYLEHQAEQSKLYDLLSTKLPVPNPDLVQGQVHNLFPQIVDHLLKGAPAPVADFGSGPVNLNVIDPSIISFTQSLPSVAQFAPIAIVILIILIIIVARDKSLRLLSRASFGAAVGLGLSIAFFWFSPYIILKLINSSDAEPIKAAFGPFLFAVFHDVATQLIIAAIALLAAAVILRLIHSGIRLSARYSKPPKLDTPSTPGIVRS